MSAVLAVLLGWLDGEFKSPEELIEWSDFSVVNTTTRQVTGQEYDNGVFISGELEFESSPPSDFAYISVTLRDTNGVFVDVCEEKYLLTGEFTRPFKVHCDEIYSFDDFAKYEISVHAVER